MASEIRANTLKNRVGLGTVSFTNTGTVVSGIVTANTIRLADDNKIQLGNDQDLEIVHDPSNGIIRSISSGGNMHVESKNHIELNVNYNPSNGSKHNAIKANANSSVSLYHANSTKFATTSTGAQVYGTLVATGADINGDLDVDGHTELDNINISGVSTHVGLSQFQNTINLTHASAGQNYIYFNEDLQFAKNGTGTRLKIDSNGVVGINTDASGNGSGAKLVVGGRVQSNNGGYWFADANGAENGWHVQDSGGNLIIVESGVAERLRIGSSGQIGLGGANYGSSGQVLTSGGSGSAATWSTVSGTTINSNADNRVITGSGTANTLNGESNLTFTGSLLTVTGNISLPDSSAPDYIGNIYVGNNSDLKIFHNGSDNFIRSGAGNHNIRIDNNAGVLGARFIPAGAAELYHNGTKMCETSTNGLAFPAGKGIDFSADGSGTLKTLPNSFNAEVLHDYENGTFTPNIQYDTGTNRYAGSNVSSSSVGEYIRIGDLVSFGMKIILTGNRNYSENTHIYIGGLPYNGMHSSQQSSMQSGWGGWACPTNDNNFSYDVRYCFHGYTTVNLGFSQSSGNGGISGFYVWGFYRTAP